MPTAAVSSAAFPSMASVSSSGGSVPSLPSPSLSPSTTLSSPSERLHSSAEAAPSVPTGSWVSTSAFSSGASTSSSTSYPLSEGVLVADAPVSGCREDTVVGCCPSSDSASLSCSPVDLSLPPPSAVASSSSWASSLPASSPLSDDVPGALDCSDPCPSGGGVSSPSASSPARFPT
ncbi:unnamed protein product, partial [Ectocarpus sp. 12 AP-2014]